MMHPSSTSSSLQSQRWTGTALVLLLLAGCSLTSTTATAAAPCAICPEGMTLLQRKDGNTNVNQAQDGLEMNTSCSLMQVWASMGDLTEQECEEFLAGSVMEVCECVANEEEDTTTTEEDDTNTSNGDDKDVPLQEDEPPVEENDDSGLSAGAIVGIVAAILVLGVVAYMYYNSQKKEVEDSNNENSSSPIDEHPSASSAVVKADGGGSVTAKGSGSVAESTSRDEDDNLFAEQMYETQEITAPPGKLGLNVDTSLAGPIVREVKPTSALEGSLFEGDIIVGVNGVNTRGMTAKEFLDVLISSADAERVLKVNRAVDEVDDSHHC